MWNRIIAYFSCHVRVDGRIDVWTNFISGLKANQKKRKKTKSKCLFLGIHLPIRSRKKRGEYRWLSIPPFDGKSLLIFLLRLRHKYRLSFLFVFDKFETNRKITFAHIKNPFLFFCSFHYQAGSAGQGSDVGYLYNFSEWQALFGRTHILEDRYAKGSELEWSM